MQGVLSAPKKYLVHKIGAWDAPYTTYFSKHKFKFAIVTSICCSEDI